MTEKLYFKIGEACKRLDIQPYVLRYWETEFPALSPDKSKSGQRVYTRHDLEIIRRIKELLYDEGYTIAGAKKKLEGELASGALSAGRAKAKAAGGGKAEETEAAEPAPEAPAKKTAQARLDSDAADAKMLREGVREALKEARAILAILESSAD